MEDSRKNKAISADDLIGLDNQQVDDLLRKKGNYIQFLENPTIDQCKLAVEQNGYALRYIRNQTKELVDIAIEKQPTAIRYALKPTTDQFTRCFGKDPTVIAYMHSPTEEHKMSAVMRKGGTIQYIKNPSDLLIDVAIKQDPMSLGYIYNRVSDNKLRELIQIAIKRKPKAVKNVINSVPQSIIEFILSIKGECLRYLKNQTEELCLVAIENNPLAIEYVVEQTSKIQSAIIDSRNSEAIAMLHENRDIAKESSIETNSQQHTKLEKKPLEQQFEENDIVVFENDPIMAEKILSQVQRRIRNENDLLIQQLMNDVVVLTLLRIMQLIDFASSECEVVFSYIKQLSLSEDVVKIQNDQTTITEAMISNKLQVFVETISHEILVGDTKVRIIKKNNYDIKRLQGILIRGFAESHIKPVESNAVFSRFLWIAYSRVLNVEYESIENRHVYIDFDDFRDMIKNQNVMERMDYKWRGDVIDAALLAKSRVEKELQIPNSLDFNHRSISVRIIDHIKNHETISNNCIVKQLQTAMDRLCMQKTNDGITQYKIRTRDMRWFLSLFEGVQGEAYLQIPTQNALWDYFEDTYRQRIRNKTATDDKIVDDKLLQGKRLICYDNKMIAIGTRGSVPIFVAQGSVSCQRNHHVIINVEAIVRTVKENKEVKLPIQKCVSCKPSRYFISDVVLDEYEKKHGLMYFRRIKYYDDNPDDTDKEEWINQKTESIMFKMGYTVSEKTGLSDSERQRLLVRIISSGEISKTQAMRHIEGLIRRNEGNSNFLYAVPKWKRDLYYLANLKDVDLLYYGRLYR